MERTSFRLFTPRPEDVVTPPCRSGLNFSKTGVSVVLDSASSPPTSRCWIKFSMAGVPSFCQSSESGHPLEALPSSTPGCRYRCILSTCSDIILSRCSSVSSVTTKSRSKRERSESGRAMFRCGSLCTSYCIDKDNDTWRRDRLPDRKSDWQLRSRYTERSMKCVCRLSRS